MGRKAQALTKNEIDGIFESAARHGYPTVKIDLGNGASATASKATQPSTVTVLENDEWKVAS
jgi:hypothetical protein